MIARVPTWGLVLLASALWGSNFVAMKLALVHSSPLLLAALRALLGGALLLAIASARGARLPRERRLWLGVFHISLQMTTLSSAFMMLGVARVPAGIAALLANTMPLFMAIVAPLLLAERTTRLGALGLLIGFGGTAVIAAPGGAAAPDPLGIFFMLLAPALWATGSVTFKRLDLSQLDPLMLVAIQLLMSAVGLTVLTAVLEPTRLERNPGLIAPLAYTAVLGLALAFVIWNEILRRGSAVQASATAYLIPVFGILSGALVLDERLAPAQLLGALLVLVGVALVSSSGTRQPAPDAASLEGELR